MTKRQMHQAEKCRPLGKGNCGKCNDTRKGNANHRSRWSALHKGNLSCTQEMQNQHLCPHGLQKPPRLKQSYILQLHCRIGKALIRHSAAQHRAEHIIQKQKRHDIKQRADWPKGKHKPPQCPPGPIPWRKSFLLIHIIPRDCCAG